MTSIKTENVDLPLVRFDRKSESGPKAFFHDLIEGLRQWRVWSNFAGQELVARYYGSWIGIAWLGISFTIFVLAIALYFRGMGGVQLMYVAVGMAAYQYVVGNLNDGCTVFVTSRSWIDAVRMPFSIYVYKSMARSLVPFLMNLGICAAIGFAMHQPFYSSTWISVGVMGLFLINGVWLQYLCGRLVADFNPVTHFIQVFRMPILGEGNSAFHWTIVLSLTIAGWLFTILIVSLFRHKLTKWMV